MQIDFNKISEQLAALTLRDFKKSRKDDGSWVTDVDYLLDEAIRNFIQAFTKIPVYSEESPFSLMEFPCFIVDPLDGTKDFINGNGEFSISIAYAHTEQIDNPKSYGWIFRPATGEIFDSSKIRCQSNNKEEILVSRSEFDSGLYKIMEKGGNIKPIGSICLKLGMLAAAQASAVISLRPKSVWDVAAGSILLNKIGVKIYEQGQEIKKLENRRYGPTLVWATPDNAAKINESMKPSVRK